jgi:NAD(P)-dependent dehydrogenase (short-subunit alcohol dehydrogenase family)
MTTAILMPTQFVHKPIDVPIFSLLGKKALVTGGSRGIGRAIALALASAGADVAVASSQAGTDLADDVCRMIHGMGRRAEFYSFDVAARDEVEETCARVKSDFKEVDILVNNAGITRDRSFRKMDRGAWDEVININLNSVFDITRAFIEGMVSRGWGRIINISSVVGRIGNIGQTNYAASKAGLIGLTKSLAREYARKGVTVNAIAPGFVKTRMLESGVSETPRKSLRGSSISRLRHRVSLPVTCSTSTADWRCDPSALVSPWLDR